MGPIISKPELVQIMAWSRHQTVKWTNDGLAYSLQCVSLGLDELNTFLNTRLDH